MAIEQNDTPVEGGAEFLHRVWFTGALAFLFGPGVIKQLKTGLPRTLLSLEAYAEKRHQLT